MGVLNLSSKMKKGVARVFNSGSGLGLHVAQLGGL